MGFQQGLSGLNAATKQLDVIGNNVANTNTVGFKQSQAQFADVFAASMTGAGAAAIGLGTKVAAIPQQFTQGNITTTNNSLDVAINGNGFFRMSNNGTVMYARNGQFQIDKNGFIVDSKGAQLTGYLPNPTTGTIVQASPSPIQINSAFLPPVASSSVIAGLNLNSGSTVPAVATFSPTNTSSFNTSTSLTSYDSLGNSHVSTLYFQMSAANTWNVYLTQDGVQVPVAGTALGVLNFNTNGTIVTPAVLTSASFTPAGASAQTLAFDFTTTTQYGSPFSVNSMTQNGYSTGSLAGFSIGKDGIISGSYSNGQTKSLAQVALASFTNPQGLQPQGNNNWLETAASGQPLIGVPGTGRLGVLQSAATEDSNVDLTAELVNMITAQRFYQANAQTIKTQDQVMQTLVNMR